MSRAWRFVFAIPLLAGCGDWLGAPEEPPLPGERVAILNLEQRVQPDPRIAGLDVRLPDPIRNPDWPQAGGTAGNARHHLAADDALEPFWRTDIGAGSSDQAQLLAQPVIAGGRVYTLDVDAEARAFDAQDGALLWRAELKPGNEDGGTLGGGLALDGGRLYVTTGFARVFALDAATGEAIWERAVPGPVRAGPTVRDDRVFVVTIANELHALRTSDGDTVWTHAGIAEVAGLIGGAEAAVDGDVVVAPFSSGELVALRTQNGRVLWSESLTAIERTDPVSSLAHIRGRPVIDGGRVFVVGHGGRMTAIDLRTGARVWEQPIGGTQAPWIAGRFVYVVSTSAKLICLSRRDGGVRWVRELPRYEDPEDREDAIRWAGPVLAGGRLLVAGTQGELLAVSPYSGEILGRMDIASPITISPAVADRTVYLLTEDAELIAFR